MALDSLLTALRSHLERESPDLVAAYLFGSMARGEDRSTSDVDLALLYREPPPESSSSASSPPSGPVTRRIESKSLELAQT